MARLRCCEMTAATNEKPAGSARPTGDAGRECSPLLSPDGRRAGTARRFCPARDDAGHAQQSRRRALGASAWHGYAAAMPNYRRARAPGATYFFTVVTAQRRPLLANSQAIAALRASVADARQRLPFSIVAWVVLPDHMHAIWSLPPHDRDFSKRWGLIKAGVTGRLTCAHRSAPRQDSGLWQRRFWEHLVRDEADLRAHVDYVHYNPVKHGLASRVVDWPYSTFHGAVQRGTYAADWGSVQPTATWGAGFGE